MTKSNKDWTKKDVEKIKKTLLSLKNTLFIFNKLKEINPSVEECDLTFLLKIKDIEIILSREKEYDVWIKMHNRYFDKEYDSDGKTVIKYKFKHDLIKKEYSNTFFELINFIDENFNIDYTKGELEYISCCKLLCNNNEFNGNINIGGKEYKHFIENNISLDDIYDERNKDDDNNEFVYLSIDLLKDSK